MRSLIIISQQDNICMCNDLIFSGRSDERENLRAQNINK